MARKKRKSRAVERALKRSAALAAIDEHLDLGNNLTLGAYNTSIQAQEKAVELYNTMLSGLDAKLTEIKAGDKALGQLSTRMLKAVATKYGENSEEYQKAGGKRTSERKHPTRKPAPASASNPASPPATRATT